MASYETFTESIAEEVALFKNNQAKGIAREEQRYLCLFWCASAVIDINYPQGENISSRVGSREGC